MPKLIVDHAPEYGNNVFIERIKEGYSETFRRAFRIDANGNAEMAYLTDLHHFGERARWYGHVYTRDDFDFRRKGDA